MEDIQKFTSQRVPCPRWVKIDNILISQESITESARLLALQLGQDGVNQVGGVNWWQWRGEGETLKAEWIEMRSHFAERQRVGDHGRKVMLYVHGGAYFFGSVDAHRHQMQRHARKLEARVLARYFSYPIPAGVCSSTD